MKKFRTWYDAKIEEVEVARETAKFVILAHPKGMRMSKRSSDPGEWQYFDTWSEARQFLIDREKTKIRALCDELDKHETTLRKLQEMSQP